MISGTFTDDLGATTIVNIVDSSNPESLQVLTIKFLGPLG